MRLPSGPFVWLLRKERRELMASRSWWAMLALVGPLVGFSFANAVRTYGEISAGAGAGCGPVCAPLVGIWGPTFGAYEIAAIFLLPFVAIRQVAGDRQSGALKLELQHPMPVIVRLAAKTIVLLLGCATAGAAGLLAIVLWTSYGGTAYAPEILVVLSGHLLNAALTIAVAAVAASIAEHPSTAAIATLAFTVGTWILEFAGAITGGIWERLARFTPGAMVGTFQRGLLQANTVLVALVLVTAGLAIAAAWLHIGDAVRRRIGATLAIASVAAVAVVGVSFVRGYWDGSESRQNSFSEAEEEALERLGRPLAIEVHLAPEDPRRGDLERQALTILRRVLPHVRVTYVSRTTSGLFEQHDPSYGEIWYDLGGARAMSRVTTQEGVLETIFDLAGASPAEEAEPPYRGHPLVATARGAALTFYGLWPALVGAAGYISLRRPS